MDIELKKSNRTEYGGMVLIGLWFICYGVIKILNQSFDFFPDGIAMRTVQILTYTPLILGIFVINQSKTNKCREEVLKVQYTVAITILFLAIPLDVMTTFSLCGYGFLTYYVPRLATLLTKERQKDSIRWVSAILKCGERLYILFIVMVAILTVYISSDSICRIITYFYYSLALILGLLYCITSIIVLRKE